MPIKRAFVYILKCADGTFYIGTARDVEQRVAVHNAKKGAKYTRARLPVKVVYQEGPVTLTRALRREYQLKQLTRKEKKAFIAGELEVQPPRPPKKKKAKRSGVRKALPTKTLADAG